MMAIRSRIIGLVVGFVIGLPFVVALDPGTQATLTSILTTVVDNLLTLAALLGYTVVHPWIQKRLNPTGAMTTEAASKLEHVAHVQKAT